VCEREREREREVERKGDDPTEAQNSIKLAIEMGGSTFFEVERDFMHSTTFFLLGLQDSSPLNKLLGNC